MISCLESRDLDVRKETTAQRQDGGEVTTGGIATTRTSYVKPPLDDHSAIRSSIEAPVYDDRTHFGRHSRLNQPPTADFRMNDFLSCVSHSGASSYEFVRSLARFVLRQLSELKHLRRSCYSTRKDQLDSTTSYRTEEF